jgi:hypothetical protein
MLNKNTIDNLKIRHSDLHPLILNRSVEHSKSDVELFDILETFPKKYPVIWSDKKKSWVYSKRLF